MSIAATVTKSNTLIQASYKLSLNEQRLLLLCVAQLDGRKPLPKDNLFSVNAVDFGQTFGIDDKSSYAALEEAAGSLYQRDIKVHDGKVRHRFRWVYHVQYHDGEGRVSLAFSPTVAPYLTMLHKQFTSYRLEQVASLRSIYSIRLYEMLMQFKSTGHLSVGLADFKEWLELGEQYPRFVDLKRRVIAPAVIELQAKSRLSIVWKAHRKGRSVDRLEFAFNECSSNGAENTKTERDATPG
jgi:plasmid replication initiation protein